MKEKENQLIRNLDQSLKRKGYRLPRKLKKQLAKVICFELFGKKPLKWQEKAVRDALAVHVSLGLKLDPNSFRIFLRNRHTLSSDYGFLTFGSAVFNATENGTKAIEVK
jgi:hypothetical protein